MAHFRGEVQGNRGAASRQSDRARSLTTVAASWQGCVRVELYASAGVDYALVRLEPWNGAGRSVLLYEGPVSAAPFVAGAAVGEPEPAPEAAPEPDPEAPTGRFAAPSAPESGNRAALDPIQAILDRL